MGPFPYGNTRRQSQQRTREEWYAIAERRYSKMRESGFNPKMAFDLADEHATGVTLDPGADLVQFEARYQQAAAIEARRQGILAQRRAIKASQGRLFAEGW
jgi:hypothetical protein